MERVEEERSGRWGRAAKVGPPSSCGRPAPGKNGIEDGLSVLAMVVRDKEGVRWSRDNQSLLAINWRSAAAACAARYERTWRAQSLHNTLSMRSLRCRVPAREYTAGKRL